MPLYEYIIVALITAVVVYMYNTPRKPPEEPKAQSEQERIRQKKEDEMQDYIQRYEKLVTRADIA